LGSVLVLASYGCEAVGSARIFYRGHNQNQGRTAFTVDSSGLAVPPLTENVCNELNNSPKCRLSMCEASPTLSMKNASHCSCYRSSLMHCPSNSLLGLGRQKFVGLASASDWLQSEISRRHIATYGSRSIGLTLTTRQRPELPPLILQEWESGNMKVPPIVEVQTNFQRNGSFGCGWNEICFCGTAVCEGFKPLPVSSEYHLPPQAANSTARSINNANLVPLPGSYSGTSVNVILGLQPGYPCHSSRQDGQDGECRSKPFFGKYRKDEFPSVGFLDSWGFQDDVIISRPWTQRHMLELCSLMPKALGVTHKSCWIQSFKDWLTKLNERFPVNSATRFEKLILQFAATGMVGLASPKQFLWIRGKKVVACYLEFNVALTVNSEKGKLLRLKQWWDDHIELWNSGSPQAPFARGAWHTSELWAHVEAQEELASSTIKAVAWFCAFAFSGFFLSTKDFGIAFAALACEAWSFSLCLFLITVVFGWDFGPMEVITLLISLCFTTTYSALFAQAYCDPEAVREMPADDLSRQYLLGGDFSHRYLRVAGALRILGREMLVSLGLSAAGAIVLMAGQLAYSELRFFGKLATGILTASLLAGLTSFIYLPILVLTLDFGLFAEFFRDPQAAWLSLRDGSRQKFNIRPPALAVAPSGNGGKQLNHMDSVVSTACIIASTAPAGFGATAPQSGPTKSGPTLRFDDSPPLDAGGFVPEEDTFVAGACHGVEVEPCVSSPVRSPRSDEALTASGAINLRILPEVDDDGAFLDSDGDRLSPSGFCVSTRFFETLSPTKIRM